MLSYIIKNIKSSTFFNEQNYLIKLNQEKIVQVLVVVVPLDPMQTLQITYTRVKVDPPGKPLVSIYVDYLCQ